jgi:hypothetical protein
MKEHEKSHQKLLVLSSHRICHIDRFLDFEILQHHMYNNRLELRSKVVSSSVPKCFICDSLGLRYLSRIALSFQWVWVFGKRLKMGSVMLVCLF